MWTVLLERSQVEVYKCNHSRIHVRRQFSTALACLSPLGNDNKLKASSVLSLCIFTFPSGTGTSDCWYTGA